MEEKLYDIGIIGCGPAGLSAAINGVIRNKDVIVLGGEFCSNRLHLAPKVDNYLGFWDISGPDLREKYLNHAAEMGISINQGKVDRVFDMGNEFGIMVKEQFYRCKSVIIATGVSTAKYIPGEQGLVGKGVGYCGTCDGPLYRGKKVAVLGYVEEEAVHEANFLGELCEAVYYVPMHNGDPQKLTSKVQVVKGQPKEIVGENILSKLILQDGQEIDIDGLFIIRDMVPSDQLVPGLEIEDGGIKVNRRMETSIKGIYAAGDCAGKPYQLAKAVGEGQVAALYAVEYLANRE